MIRIPRQPITQGGIIRWAVIPIMALLAIAAIAATTTTAQAQTKWPPNPTNLRTTAVTSTSVTIAWNAGPDNGCATKQFRLSGYDRENGRFLEVANPIVPTSGPLTKTFINLQPETPYLLIVSAEPQREKGSPCVYPTALASTIWAVTLPAAETGGAIDPTPRPGNEDMRGMPEENTATPTPKREIEVVKDGTTYGKSQGQTPKLTITEGDSGTKTVPLTLRLTGTPSDDVSVQVKFQKPNDKTVRGKKKAGADRDFYFIDQVITWEAGASGTNLNKTVNLRIIGDTREENDETVRFSVNRLTTDDRNVKFSGSLSRIFIEVVIANDD